MIDLYIDNNVWDLLFDLRLDLCAEFPRGEFRLLVTREGEMEIAPIPERKAALKAFIDVTIARCVAARPRRHIRSVAGCAGTP